MDSGRYEKINSSPDSLTTRHTARSGTVKRGADQQKRNKRDSEPEQKEPDAQRLPHDEVDLHLNNSVISLNDIRILLQDMIGRKELDQRSKDDLSDSENLTKALNKTTEDDLSEIENPAFSQAAATYESYLLDDPETGAMTDDSRPAEEGQYRDRTGFLDQSPDQLSHLLTTVEHLLAIGQKKIDLHENQSYAARLMQIGQALPAHKKLDSE